MITYERKCILKKNIYFIEKQSGNVDYMLDITGFPIKT